MINQNKWQFSAIFLWCSVLGLTIDGSVEFTSLMPIQILSGFDNRPIWIGLVNQDRIDASMEWSLADSREFSIEVSDSVGDSTIVVLKRDSIPIVKSLTSEMLAEAVIIEFSEGNSVSGTVVAVKTSMPITEGLVSVQFDETLGIPVPEEESVFAWELEEGGTFEIRGLPAGEHIVTANAPGYMPAQQQLRVELGDQLQELHFQLAKAVHIQGYLFDGHYQAKVEDEGTIDVVVSPPESQTTEVRTEFDNEGNFKLGPFAEDATVELVARTADELRSRPILVTLPTDDIVIYVHQWYRVKGTVRDRDTGEPFVSFKFIHSNYEELEIEDERGQFNVEICDDRYNLTVGIRASGYSFWSSRPIFPNSEGDDVDLGIIELEPVYTVRGRVLDQETREPIEGAEVLRDDPSLGTGPRGLNIRVWLVLHVKTTTNADGEFQLSGFPAKNSTIVVSAPEYESISQTFDDVNVPLEFELKPIGTIRGQVVSLNGEPVAGRISVSNGAISTDDDGSFEFKVRAGTHRYRAFTDLGTSKVVEVTVENGQSVEDVRLVIENIGRVFGSIEGLLEEETASVWVDGVAGSSEYGASNGTVMLTGIPAGHHVMKSNTSFGRELETSVYVDEALEGHATLIFQGGYALSGKVIAESRGVAGRRVNAIPVDSSLPIVRTITIRDGSYRFKGLVNGHYKVEVPRHGFTQQVLVQGDTYSDLHVHAQRLSGKVRGSSSVEGAEVRLSGGVEGQEISLWTKVRANGSYLLKGIPSGTYTLKISHPDFAEVSQQVDVFEERVKLDLQLNEVKLDVED